MIVRSFGASRPESGQPAHEASRARVGVIVLAATVTTLAVLNLAASLA